VRQLRREIESMLYERIGLSKNKKQMITNLPSGLSESPLELVKNPYVLEFLGIEEKAEYSENDLEKAIIDNLQKFLLELGYGFCFEARQKRILIENIQYKIDLVFYHRILKCHVLIDLKVGSFSHADAGINEFFYFDKNVLNNIKIENEYLKPIIKSPRECFYLTVDEKDLKYYVFICNKDKKELINTKALSYIKEGEKKKYNLIPSVRGRKNWLQLGKIGASNFLWTMTYRERFFVIENHKVIADARFYDMVSENYVGAICNSIIILLQLEIMARGYGGGGPVDVKVYEVKNLLIPDLVHKKDKIDKCFNKFKFRKIGTIFEEYGINPESEIPIEKQDPNPLHDRAELDNIVFDALELTEEERKEVYRSVCRLVWNRISKAKSV